MLRVRKGLLVRTNQKLEFSKQMDSISKNQSKRYLNLKTHLGKVWQKELFFPTETLGNSNSVNKQTMEIGHGASRWMKNLDTKIKQ